MFQLRTALLMGACAIVLEACGGSVSATSSPSSIAATAPANQGSASSASGLVVPSNLPIIGDKVPGPYSSTGVTAAGAGSTNIEANDALKFQPNTIVAKPGQALSLQFKNSGFTAHTFVSPSLGVAKAQDIPLQKTSTVTFSAPTQPGVYQFWCNIPGHVEAGMSGEVIVSPG